MVSKKRMNEFENIERTGVGGWELEKWGKDK